MNGTDQTVRFLLIEDNLDRITKIKSWIPAQVRCVVANSAGKAIGILQRDCGRLFAGILLDHDLNEQALTSRVWDLSGKQMGARLPSNKLKM